jgi:hypothetical protein
MTKAATQSKGDVMESPGDMPEGLEKNKNSFKVSNSKTECESGTKDPDLRAAASGIYSKAVKSGAGSYSGKGDKAFQDR